MAKREAHARSVSPGEETPATLISATEEHARALRRQLLESTELAAKQMIGQTRAEGERRIEVAGRRAQAIAETVAQIEQAEQALADRAREFASASKSLRAELESFAAVLSGGEERLAPGADEPELRLVASPAPERARPEPPPPSGIAQILLADESDELEEPGEDEGDDDNRPEEELDEDDDEEDSAGGEPEDSAEEDRDEDPPTPAEIARFFREHEEGELTHAARLEREAEGKLSIGERLRYFFSGPPEAEEAVAEEPARAERSPKAETVRPPARQRLYTDVGGALIGLGGAAALINFVLID